MGWMLKQQCFGGNWEETQKSYCSIFVREPEFARKVLYCKLKCFSSLCNSCLTVCLWIVYDSTGEGNVQDSCPEEPANVLYLLCARHWAKIKTLNENIYCPRTPVGLSLLKELSLSVFFPVWGRGKMNGKPRVSCRIWRASCFLSERQRGKKRKVKE